MVYRGLRCSVGIGSVLLVCSCTLGGTPKPLETLFDTLPNGSVSVSNILPQGWVGESGLSSIEELRIGTVDEEGPAQFVMVEAIDVSADGEIFILDSFDRTVRVFHPNGDFAFSFGQRGEGPGEFERPVGMRLTPGGRLLVRGPNVMLGYLMAEQPGRLLPPATVYGEGWYDTGDIVDIDSEGYVWILGRAKRFAKLGGEMVSLAAVEELALRTWPDAAHAAISVPDPQKGEKLVLLTEYAGATRQHLLEQAHRDGLSEINVPRRLIRVAKIPLLGSGKVDYAAARAVAEQLDAGEGESS